MTKITEAEREEINRKAITKLVDEAPPLSEKQKAIISLLLRGSDRPRVRRKRT